MSTQTVVTYGLGGFDPGKPNGNIVSEEAFDTPDEKEAAVLAVDKMPAADLDALTAFVQGTEKEASIESLTEVLRVITGKLIAVAPTEVAPNSQPGGLIVVREL